MGVLFVLFARDIKADGHHLQRKCDDSLDMVFCLLKRNVSLVSYRNGFWAPLMYDGASDAGMWLTLVMAMLAMDRSSINAQRMDMVVLSMMTITTTTTRRRYLMQFSSVEKGEQIDLFMQF